MSSEDNKQHVHVMPLKIYLMVGAALMVLTAVTVGVSFIPLGGWNAVVAVGIASIKAALVALFFMHLLYDKKINLVIFLAALTFLTVFITLTMFETLSRGDVDEITRDPIRKEAVMYDKMKGDSTGAIHSPDSIEVESESGH